MALAIAPILWLPRIDWPFMLKTDASNHSIAAVLSLYASSEGSLLFTLAIYRKKLNAARRKNLGHNYKMLDII